MSIRNKAAILFALSLSAALAQPASSDLRTALKIDFPKDSPLTVVSADLGDSVVSTRGSAMIVDLHTSLSLRNSGLQRVRGVTILVMAQDAAAGGKASVAVPSLNVGPGETFPVRIDLRLLRPLSSSGPLAQVSLDGVLFDDLSFYGPNRLDSRRTMTAWEMESQRDRRYFKSVLAARGEEALRKSLLDSIARQADRPRLDVQVARGGRATNLEAERAVQFAFLRMPDAPIEPLEGTARIAGNEARAASLEVRNRSHQTIRYFEVGWIIRDASGREFLAGSFSASDPGLKLAPGQTSRVLQDVSLRFSSAPGRPISIAGMSGFVSQVEFTDGSIWIPSRAALSDPALVRVVAPSPEEQRLTELYRKKGLAAIVAELKQF